MPWIDDDRLPDGLLRPLTKRQLDAARLAALGLDLQQIADGLGVSYDRAKQLIHAIAALLPNARRLKPLLLVRQWAVAQEFNRQGREPPTLPNFGIVQEGDLSRFDTRQSEVSPATPEPATDPPDPTQA